MPSPKKKSWTFLPERSRVPPNRRATRRQTTVRAFTFVQDWASGSSPAASHEGGKGENQAVGKQGVHLGSGSDASVRESPIAQLIRASPGPIIIARRPAGTRDRSFKNPVAPSPPSSISSQSSVRSRRRATDQRQHRIDGKLSSSRNDGTFIENNSSQSQERSEQSHVPSSQSRERHSSGSTTRSPAPVIISQAASTPKDSDSSQALTPQLQSPDVISKSGGLTPLSPRQNIVENSGATEISRVPQLGESSPDKELTASVNSSQLRTQGSFVQAEDPSRTLDESANRSSDHHGANISQASRSSSITHSRRKRRSDVLTFRKKSTKKRTDSPSVSQGRLHIANNDVGGSTSSRMSTSHSSSQPGSGRMREHSSRKKRQSDLSFRKKHKVRRSLEHDTGASGDSRSGAGADIRRWARPGSSGSDGNQSSAVSSSHPSASGQGKGHRSKQMGAESTRNIPGSVRKTDHVDKGQAKPTPRTPANKSVSLIAVTPKSGHVQRSQPRVQTAKQRQDKGKKSSTVSAAAAGAAARKRAIQSESSENEDVSPQSRAKVRLWMTGARPRLLTDTTDLDVLLNTLEDTTTDFREALSTRSHKKAVSMFLEEAKQELMSMISLQQEFKLQTTTLTRTNNTVRKYKHQHLGLEKKTISLDTQIAAARKKQGKKSSPEGQGQDRVNSFLTELQDLHENYTSKYPGDVKKLKFDDAQSSSEGALRDLKSSLDVVPTLRILNDRLQDWLDSH